MKGININNISHLNISPFIASLEHLMTSEISMKPRSDWEINQDSTSQQGNFLCMPLLQHVHNKRWNERWVTRVEKVENGNGNWLHSTHYALRKQRNGVLSIFVGLVCPTELWLSGHFHPLSTMTFANKPADWRTIFLFQQANKLSPLFSFTATQF